MHFLFKTDDRLLLHASRDDGSALLAGANGEQVDRVWC